MGDLTMWLRTIRRARLVLPALVIAIAGCGGGQVVTPEAIRAAKQVWTRSGLRDYDLDWSVSGPNNAHYLVTVRDAEVRTIESIRPDGSKVPLHPVEMRMYSVDGLFRTIDEELAVCSKNEHPFGQPKGTKVVMRFLPDAKLGYPRWYHRDVLGSPISVAIDVNSLTSAPASAKGAGNGTAGTPR